MTSAQEKEERLKEERWQDCLRIMDEIVSACILEFNIMQAGKLKSGSGLVRRLIELLGTTEFPLNDDAFMNRVVKMLDDEQERLAIRKEAHLSQAEFMRLRRLRLLGVISPDEENHPDGTRKKRIKGPNLTMEVEKIKELEKKPDRDTDDLRKVITSLQGKSAAEQSSLILKVSSLLNDESEVEYLIRDRSREHPLLKDFDACRSAKGLYSIAEKMIVTTTTKS